MNTNISLGFLAITGAFISAQTAIAHNSFSTVQTPLLNNTLINSVSASTVNDFTQTEHVDVRTVPITTRVTNFQPDVFSSDVATIPAHSYKISATPSQSDSEASVEILVPPPKTQIIKGQSPSVTAMPTAPKYKPTLSIDRPANQSSSIAIYPLANPARISSRFGWRTHPLTGSRRFHSGIDIAAPSGAPVLATGSGTVISAGWNGGYGKAIIIQHNDTQQTLYGHLSEVSVQAGQKIEQGTVIGLVGSTGNSTGPHLHFESRTSTTAGWVAIDPDQDIQYAVDSLRRSMPYAQKDLPPGI